jgi:16S rRNA (cytosine967-C5)-methyltransferase
MNEGRFQQSRRSRRPAATGSGAREVAVRTLRRRFERSIPFVESFESSDFRRMSLADQLLARELVSGVVRQLSLIDYWLEAVSSRPLDRLDALVLWVLRISVYQIHWLRVPDYASVDEAVRLVGTLGRGRARSFVNAVLRSFLRSRPGEPEGHSVQALAVRYSHPRWLVERWYDRFGAGRTEEILSRNNSLPPSVVRINTFRTTPEAFIQRLADEDIPAELLPGIPACARVESRGFVRHDLYRQGYCFFMDYSSQQVAHLGDPGNVGRAADLCAAPGGKSFILASRLRPGAVLVCADADLRRLECMRVRARNLAVSTLQFLQADATNALPLTSGFGWVLADVPCSGLGTIRSNPDVRWFVRESDLDRWQDRQRRILLNAFKLLLPGGELIYSTCSTEPEENEQVVETLLDADSRAILQGEYWRSFPPTGPGDGFFAARIRRS